MCIWKEKWTKELTNAFTSLWGMSEIERLIKLEKGKTSGRISTIMKRHTASKLLSPKLVSQLAENSWTVQSSESNQQYTVVRESEICSFGCELKCTECGICVHMYCCNCADALLHHTICKHIHLVITTNMKKRGRWNWMVTLHYKLKVSLMP